MRCGRHGAEGLYRVLSGAPHFWMSGAGLLGVTLAGLARKPDPWDDDRKEVVSWLAGAASGNAQAMIMQIAACRKRVGFPYVKFFPHDSVPSRQMGRLTRRNHASEKFCRTRLLQKYSAGWKSMMQVNSQKILKRICGRPDHSMTRP